MRFVVSAGGYSAGVRPVWTPAGAGDGYRVFAGDDGDDVAVTAVAGSVVWALDLLCGWGVVPRVLVWDNEPAVGKWRGGKPELTAAMNAFRGDVGHQGDCCAVLVIPRPKGWWSGLTATGDLVSAGALVRFAGGLQQTTNHVVSGCELPYPSLEVFRQPLETTASVDSCQIRLPLTILGQVHGRGVRRRRVILRCSGSGS